MTTFKGRKTAIARGAVLSSSSRALSSRTLISMLFSLFEIPIRSQNRRIAEGG